MPLHYPLSLYRHPFKVRKHFWLSDVLLLPELRSRTAALSAVRFCCFSTSFFLNVMRPSAVSDWAHMVIVFLLLPVYATTCHQVQPLHEPLHDTRTGIDCSHGAAFVMYYEYPIATRVLMELLFAVGQLCLLIAKLHAYECFPSAVCATGVTVLLTTGLLGQAVGELLVDIARLADTWAALLIVAAGLLECQLAIRWLPQTKDAELPEVQGEVLAKGQPSAPKEPSLARSVDNFAAPISHHPGQSQTPRG